MKWNEVDFEFGCLRLEKTKTGKSVRPLGVPALALLKQQLKFPDCDFVFPSLGGAHQRQGFYQGTKRVWDKVRKLAKLEGVVIHTFRHTMGSAAVSAGESTAITGAILGHVNSRSTDIYAHVAENPARKAADRVSIVISDALSGR